MIRRRFVAADRRSSLVAVLAAASPTGGRRSRRSSDYAADTWHSFVDDDRPGHRAAGRQRLAPTATRVALHLADQHRRLPVEHDRRRATSGIISAARGDRPDRG